MSFTQDDYSEGDLVTMRMRSGRSYRTVEITAQSENVKNGRPGFDGLEMVLDSDGEWQPKHGVWGYDDQIVQIEKRGS